jgi:hypothetical protein
LTPVSSSWIVACARRCGTVIDLDFVFDIEHRTPVSLHRCGRCLSFIPECWTELADLLDSAWRYRVISARVRKARVATTTRRSIGASAGRADAYLEDPIRWPSTCVTCPQDGRHLTGQAHPTCFQRTRRNQSPASLTPLLAAGRVGVALARARAA